MDILPAEPFSAARNLKFQLTGHTGPVAILGQVYNVSQRKLLVLFSIYVSY